MNSNMNGLGHSVLDVVAPVDKNHIQKSIDQIGLEAVSRYLPKGMKLNPCDLHGAYLSHYKTDNPLCPLCTTASGGNGQTATDTEHYIDLRNAGYPELANGHV